VTWSGCPCHFVLRSGKWRPDPFGFRGLPPGVRRPVRSSGGHQRHAARRRHARAPDHFHGDRPDAPPGRRRRASEDRDDEPARDHGGSGRPLDHEGRALLHQRDAGRPRTAAGAAGEVPRDPPRPHHSPEGGPRPLVWNGDRNLRSPESNGYREHRRGDGHVRRPDPSSRSGARSVFHGGSERSWPSCCTDRSPVPSSTRR